MWRRIEVNATVDHPVERVFAYLANPLLWHEFAPACVYRRQIGDLPPDVGSQWMATDQIGPFRFHFVDELAELEPNRPRRLAVIGAVERPGRVPVHR